jgi:hypothetical protein
MTAKTATVRLYVALVSLIAALLELGASLARLAAALVLRAAVAVRPRAVTVQGRPQGRPNLRVVPPATRDVDLETGRLVTALVGMGFKLPAVRKFVEGLGDRAGREPIEVLIKEGLAALAA